MDKFLNVINALIGVLTIIVVFPFELLVKIILCILYTIVAIILLILLPYKILITKSDWKGVFEGNFGRFVENTYDYGKDFKNYDLCEKVRSMYFD